MPARISTYKGISHTHEDYALIQKARKQWTKDHKLKISAAKMVRIAIEQYLESQIPKKRYE